MIIDLLQSEDFRVICINNRVQDNTLKVGLIGVKYGYSEKMVALRATSWAPPLMVKLPDEFLNLGAWAFASNVILNVVDSDLEDN